MALRVSQKLMQTHTVEIVTATLKADASIPAAERTRLLRIFRGEPMPAPNGNSQPPRIYSRTKAAEMLGEKSTRYVDQLCRRGLLERFVPAGNVRGIGITAKSFEQFLEGSRQ